MAISFQELYNAQPDLKSGLLNPWTLRSKREGAYQGALSDYERLMGSGTGSVPRTSAPTTLRNASTAAISPSSMPQAYGMSMGAPKLTSPTNPTPPTELTLPTYDTGKVEGLAQRFAAPAIRNLRNTVQDVQQAYYDNPNVKRMTVRDALAGYGQGLETAIGGALQQGASIYAPEYGAAVNKAGTEFNAAQARYLQENSLAAQEAMQANELASREQMAALNRSWDAYLRGL